VIRLDPPDARVGRRPSIRGNRPPAGRGLRVERRPRRIESRLRGIITDEQQNRLESIRRQFEERLERRVGLARTVWKEHAADFVDAL